MCVRPEPAAFAGPWLSASAPGLHFFISVHRISGHPYVGHLLSLYRTWEKTHRGDCPRKTALEDDHKSSPGALNPWAHPSHTSLNLTSNFEMPGKAPGPVSASVFTPEEFVLISHLYMQEGISTRFFPPSKEIQCLGFFSCICGGSDGKCLVRVMTFWRYKISP